MNFNYGFQLVLFLSFLKIVVCRDPNHCRDKTLPQTKIPLATKNIGKIPNVLSQFAPKTKSEFQNKFYGDLFEQQTEVKLTFINKTLQAFEIFLKQENKLIKNNINVLVSYLKELKEFYQFCAEVETKLYEHSTQVRLEKLSSSSEDKSKFLIDEYTVLGFLHHNQLVSIPEGIINLWPKVSNSDKKYFAKLVSDSIPHKIGIKCIKSTINSQKHQIIVNGRNVKLSDALNQSNWPMPCSKENLKEFSVIAMERVYIDANIFASGKELYVSIIAPIWVVVGYQYFKLNGVTPEPIKFSKAENGAYYGERGQDGLPGSPGGHAGSFFGICSEIRNGQKLKISADGGDGGSGQDGGDGHHGKPGKNVTSDDFHNANLPDPELVKGIFEDGELTNDELDAVIMKTTWYSKRGRAGDFGGDGGNGGNGGPPGSPGDVDIIFVKINGKQRFVPVRNSTFFGKWGKPGKGGKGGQGGKYGNNLSCAAYMTGLSMDAMGVQIGYREWGDCHADEQNKFYVPGIHGMSGEIQMFPKYLMPNNFQHWREITEYKAAFFGQDSKICRMFLEELVWTPEVMEYYDKPISFAKELEAIEERFFATDDGDQKLTLYHSYYDTFLERIAKYNSSLEGQHQIAVNIIITAVLSKISALNRHDYRLNIVKTKEYFDILVSQIASLKALRKEKAIQMESQNFKDKVNQKIREAERFIESTVQPAIIEAQNSLQNANRKLLQEISELITVAKDDLEMKKKIKKDYEMHKSLDDVMDVLEVVGESVSFLGPIGKVAGRLVSTGSKVTRGMISRPSQIRKMAKRGISSLQAGLSSKKQEYYRIKIERVERQIKVIENFGNKKDGNASSNITRLTKQTRTSVEILKESVQPKNGTVNKLKVIQNEWRLDNTIKKLREAIFRKNNKNKGSSKNTQQNDENNEYLQLLQNVTMEMISANLNKSIVIGNEEVQKLFAVIQESQEKVSKLEEKKDQFFQEILPELVAINEEISKETRDLSKQSHVGLSIKQWKIKGLLKQIQKFVGQFTNEMRVAEQFQSAFDKLDEAIALLIELYSQIERYTEKNEMAQYIANINGAGAGVGTAMATGIEDEELRGILTRLEFFMECNLFLEEYQKAMHAFKQWVFPFASRYLNDDKHENIKTPTTVEELTQNYMQKIENLRMELGKYKATIVSGDESLITGVFTSDFVSSEPFYVWRNDKWQESIKNILGGHPVHLKADVDMIGQESAAFFEQKSAIKFKSIELSFKIHGNRSRQMELNEKLNHFHVKMIHSGISLYKVMGGHFVIFDKNQTYRYSFGRTISAGHVSKNVVKYKVDLADADFLMSPYTWWTFQLIDAKPGGIGFAELKEFEGDIDLELEGEGIYLDESQTSLDILLGLKLSKFYESYDQNEMKVES